MLVAIECPRCGKHAKIGSDDASLAANDDENIVTYAPPEGFRKVQLGWRSPDTHLFCTDCGEAAVLAADR